MKFDPKIHHRRSIRLMDYDYSQPGVYFVTVDTYNKEQLLGEVIEGLMHLSQAGKILGYVWSDLPFHYPNVCLGSFCIMPDHFHGIIQLNEVKEGFQSHPLSEIVRALKTFSAKRINALRKTPGQQVWQRNYYEHIIRNSAEWEQIQAYIDENPRKWERRE